MAAPNRSAIWLVEGAAKVPVADHRGLDATRRRDLIEGVADGADAAGVQDQIAGRSLHEMGIAEALPPILRDQKDAGQNLLHQSGFSSSSWPKQMIKAFRSRTINSRPL